MGSNANEGAEPLVRFRGVQKTYDGRSLIVRKLDLDIQRGEFLTLLGPSGSGKTTTLMMLAGFESPSAGEILLDGKLINHMPPHKRNFGMVFQNYALFPHMTVTDNVAYPLTVRKVPKQDIAERVRKALATVRLDKLGARYPAQLSGGQQQRVALARALVFEPQLVLMDEPLGALDKQLREHMQLEIKQLHQELGVTFVFVTHDQSEALTMSDRVAVFDQGEIQQCASPAQLYEAPANEFVAHFIGENNQLVGEVVEHYEGVCQVRLPDGNVVGATPVNLPLSAGRASLAIRPERLELLAPDAVPLPGHSCIEARVEQTIYLGDHVRVRVVPSGQAPMTIKRALDSAGALVEPGGHVRVSWAPEQCRAFALHEAAVH